MNKFCHSSSRHLSLIASLLLMLCLAAVSLRSMASTAATAATPKAYTVGDVPNVRLSDATQYVSDPTSILSASARDSINSMLAYLERQTGIESAVVMLPSIGDDDIFDFAHNLFRTWGIGKKKSDNGFLVVFVMDQHKVRFTTGYGIEGTMTDAISRRIQMQQMVPRFKESDWDGGMMAGIRAAVHTLDGSMQPDESQDDDDDAAIVSMLVVIAIVVVTIMWIVIIGERQRCPKCHKKGLKRVATEILRDASRRRIRRTTYLCPHCGHIVKHDERIDNNSGGGIFFIPGGFGGGRGGGGGFSGGSFGGGSTGGGGATSSW